MIGYRLYFYNRAKHIAERDEFFAKAQEDALLRLQQAFMTRSEFRTIELWDENHFIHRLEREDSDAA